jgi:aminomethyltransferase
MTACAASSAPLKRTPLYDLHVALGAKMVAFAGFEMPLQYGPGILKEHLHTRAKAGLFDVSHMGQAVVLGPNHQAAALALEALVPADILNLAPGQQRYTQLLTEAGGIIDDVMVTRPGEPGDGRLLLVVNAARTDVDMAHLAARLPQGVRLERLPCQALLALQGPAAGGVMARLAPAAGQLPFMRAVETRIGAIDCHIARSGYTGEDGFEISLAAASAEELAQRLLAQEGVQAIGLGARDSLRLEAGLCLYGHDIDETTTPVEADLVWSIQRRRRLEGGFAGARRIQEQLAHGTQRRRVGIKPQGRAPAREGTQVLTASAAGSGQTIGALTSGGFGPSVNGPVAMGYVAAEHAAPGTPVQLLVRGKPIAAVVTSLPFVPHRYLRPN